MRLLVCPVPARGGRGEAGEGEGVLDVVRSAVHVRPATRSDAPALMDLWAQLRGVGGLTGQHTPVPSIERVHQALDIAEGECGARLLVADLDGEVVGMALAAHQPLTAFLDVKVLQVDCVQVRQGYERRGVGRALIAAATAYADELGDEHLVVNVIPAARHAHRFYARLGFSPVVTRRRASVSVLRRRLGLEAGPSAKEGRVARRRAVLNARRTFVPGLRRT